jgi:hypothetical protein
MCVLASVRMFSIIVVSGATRLGWIERLAKGRQFLQMGTAGAVRKDRPPAFVPSGLRGTQQSVFAFTRSSISGDPAPAVILKRDCNAEH